MPVTPRLLLPAILLLIAATAPAPDGANGPVKHGVDLWKAQDYAGAVAAWRAPAEAGDADAQFNLGQAYKLGNGVPPDLRAAESWYRKAAEQGHEQAQGLLGVVMFQNGDRAGAVPWLKLSAERGDPRAAYVYGTMLFNADNVAKDWPLAYAYMTHAAAADLPQARASLMQMDQFIPAGDRKKGLALARGMDHAKPAKVAVTTPMSATSPGAATPIQTTELPPSRPMSPPPAATAPAAPSPKPRSAPVRPVEAAAEPARGGGWRIQLGAFSDEAAARSAWSGFAGKPGLRGLRPVLVRAGKVVRLQAAALPNRADAVKACQAAGNGCFPVAP